ncbi:hypothetical protein [Saccharibacillus sacchari]|uniref:Uncharacterized protein n=1 Tax=Saccharibacillus sacchari TaxID=456493 RepID=A0ACC6P898_9BACL
MMNHSLLTEGLSIISACKKETNDIWQAHFGAAAIGSWFFAQNDAVDSNARPRIRLQAEKMVRSVAKNDVNRLGEKEAEPAVDSSQAEAAILNALERTIDGLHWVGHNVIYSAASVSAIRELGGWGTEQQIAGIIDLIGSFEKTIPGRSWIGFSASEVKRFAITPQDLFPSIRTPEHLSAFVLDELASFPVIYRAEAHHDLIGHLLTFSHALNILHDLGYSDFFERGLVPVLKLSKALRASRSIDSVETVKLVSPVDRLPLQPATRSGFLPTETEFWETDYGKTNWDFGHVFKFAHSFYDHLERAKSSNPSYIEAFRYIIAQ